MWVTLTFISANCGSLITLIPGCEWHWHLFLPCILITSHPLTNRMWVVFLPCILITSHPMTNRLWVALPFICLEVSSHPMTNSRWMILIFILAIRSHHISSHDQQHVSDIDIYFAMQPHYIPSHDQQDVSDTVIYVYHAISSHVIQWPTVCEQHCDLFLPCSLIHHPMTNSMWVTLTFISAMQSHHISSHGQQLVGDTDIYFYHALQSHHISSHDQQDVSNTDIYFC